MKKKIIFFSVMILVGFYCFPGKKSEFVNVSNWYGMLPKPIIEQFEKETGIKVRYDIFDNNEILEAKLLATNSGYDVVFPSASPYVAHQIEAGIYAPLSKELIPNLAYVDSWFWEQMQKVDVQNIYAVPYVWGTTGLLYDLDALSQHLPVEVLDSAALLFNPQYIQKIAHMGVSLLQESVDVFPLVYRYLGLDPTTKTPLSLSQVRNTLMQVRPYIKRFSGEKTSGDLLSGDLVLAQFWSADAYRTILVGRSAGKNFRYIIPKEGTSLWIDVMAIPAGAPNPKNAHAFINFMLRPDIAAKLSNSTYAVTTVGDAQQHIDPALLSVDFLYPPDEVRKKLELDIPPMGHEGRTYDKERLRLWAKIKQARD